MDDPAFEHDTPNDAAAGHLQHQARRLGWQTEDGRAPEPVSLATEKVAEIGIAQLHRGFDQRVEHRLQIECRAADYLEHVTRRSLVFERLLEVVCAAVQLAKQARGHCQVNGFWVAFGVPLYRAGGNKLGRLRTN